MRVCYLHVGGMKTGSTSIQSFMAERRRELFEAGVIASEHGTDNLGRHRPLLLEMTGQPTPAHGVGSVARLSEQLERHPTHDVLISSESLEHHFSRAPSPVIDYFASRNFKIKMILYVRHQTQRINSQYSQNIKALFANDDWMDFVAITSQWNILNYSRWFDIAKAFGAELVARPFTTSELSGGLIADFLAAIDRPRSLAREIRRMNESASNVAVAVARTLMDRLAARKIVLTARQRQMISLVLVEEDARRDNPRFQGFGDAERAQVATRYKGDNEYFASRAWPGRCWEEIFAADIAEREGANEIDRKAAFEAEFKPFRAFLGSVWPKAIAIATDPKLGELTPATMPHERRDLVGVGRHYLDEPCFPSRGWRPE